VKKNEINLAELEAQLATTRSLLEKSDARVNRLSAKADRCAELEAQLREAEAELTRKDEKLHKWALGMQEWIERAEAALNARDEAEARAEQLDERASWAEGRAEEAESQLADFKRWLDEESAFLSKDDLAATLLKRTEAAEAQLASAKAVIKHVQGAMKLACDERDFYEARLAEANAKTEAALREKAEAVRLAAEARNDTARLRAALEAVQWGNEDDEDNDGQCPYCLNAKFYFSGIPWGHASGCIIGKALAPEARVLARNEVATLRGVVEAVEWVGADLYCPWCHGVDMGGHRDNCARQLALAPEGEKK